MKAIDDDVASAYKFTVMELLDTVVSKPLKACETMVADEDVLYNRSEVFEGVCFAKPLDFILGQL